MQNLAEIFEILAVAVLETPSVTEHLGATERHGTASQALLALSAAKAPVRGLGQFAAGKDVLEGAIVRSASAGWAGDDVRGGEVGIPQASAGVVEGFRVFALHAEAQMEAAVVDELSDSTPSYYTGSTVDDLAGGHQIDEAVPVFAMSLSASLFRSLALDIGPSYFYFEAFDRASMFLDGVYSSIAVGDVVLVEVDGKIMPTTVIQVKADAVSTTDGVDMQATWMVISPASKIGTPILTDSAKIWFNAKKAGTLERIPTKTVTKDDFLNTPRPVTLPDNTNLPAQDTFILVQDAEGTTIRAKGGGQTINGTPHIQITELLEDFDDELVKPITFLWGLTTVTRGQTVSREIIGSGDSTQRWQSFRLAKSPLTYVADAFAPGGRRPELEVYVNGIKWKRAQSFYKAKPTDEIYVIRHDAEHNTFVVFGDGELGKRLPTGANNVVASYRYGVGGNVEANTITKLVRPIKGVTSVYNPLPATGGEDPPTEKEAREKAIQSTRVLGHLVALPDFEVEAARFGGVVRAQAKWAWDKAGEDAVVQVRIITADAGDPSADLRRYLLGMAEPGVRVQVSKAKPYTGELSIDLELDPAYLPEEVRAAVDARLFDEFDGLLAPRNAPIGGAFHRSELYAAIHEIPGVLSVQGVFVNEAPMGKYIALDEDEYLAIAYPQAG